MSSKMKRKLLSLCLFLVVGLLSMSRTGFGHRICGENPIPGLIVMKRGYDFLTYTFHEHQEPANMKEDIFEYTCNNNYSFFHNHTKFTYPDQFSTPFFLNGAYSSASAPLDHFEQLFEFQRSDIDTYYQADFFEKLGKRATEGKPELEKIGEAVRATSKLLVPPQKSTLSEYSSFAKNTKLHAVFRLIKITKYSLIEDLRYVVLRDDFIKAYNALPASFIKNPEPFLGFISRFGTHYMHRTEFGGRINYRTKHSSYRKNEDIYLYTSDYYENSTEEDTRIFVERRSQVIGGNVSIPAMPYNSKNYYAWQWSLSDTPSPIEVSFVPIARLITNESICFQVAQAIVYKIRKQTLEIYNELMRIIEPKHYYISPTTHNVTQFNLKKDYERQYNEFKELLYIPPSTDPGHLVNIMTRNTNDIQSKVIYLTKIFENSFVNTEED